MANIPGVGSNGKVLFIPELAQRVDEALDAVEATLEIVAPIAGLLFRLTDFVATADIESYPYTAESGQSIEAEGEVILPDTGTSGVSCVGVSAHVDLKVSGPLAPSLPLDEDGKLTMLQDDYRKFYWAGSNWRIMV